MEDRADFHALVGIEIDPSRTAPESNGRPSILAQADADQMLSHLAADLGGLLPGLGKCRLAAPGVLYDQCQLLRPGLPLFHSLKSRLRPRKQHEATPGVTAIGSGAGDLPDPVLEPDKAIPAGVLWVIPLLIEGPAALMEELAGEMEHRFLSEGQVSPHTASWLESAFGIAISHARFMTLIDLNAMLRLQLENFGFLPLWELVDGALNDGDLVVTSRSGVEFRLREGTVTAMFESFDQWARNGGGKDIDAARDRLAQAYAERTLEFRQYISTLEAHRIPVDFEAVSEDEIVPGGSFLCEESSGAASETAATVSEHSWPDVGTIAITVATPGGLKNFYPVRPGGLNDIHLAIREMALDNEGISYSGRIDYDPVQRRLVAGVMAPA